MADEENGVAGKRLDTRLHRFRKAKPLDLDNVAYYLDIPFKFSDDCNRVFRILFLLCNFLSARHDLSAVRKTRGRFTGVVYTCSVVGSAHNWSGFDRPLASKDSQKQIKTLRSA